MKFKENKRVFPHKSGIKRSLTCIAATPIIKKTLDVIWEANMFIVLPF